MVRFSFYAAIFALIIPTTGFAFDVNKFAKTYYERWTATQKVGATKADIEAYLSLLKDDVGHQHLPYAIDDTRTKDNKDKMREGMLFYLDAHDKYASTLLSSEVGFNVVLIKYFTSSEGVHPQSKERIIQQFDTVEVLELEHGKVATIRKYSE